MLYQDLFQKAGLNENEAIIYEYLIKNGRSTGGDIIKKTPLKRGVVYNVLTELKLKGLIEETKISAKGSKGKTRISSFSPNHPEKLRDFIEDKENQIIKAKREFEASAPDLISSFNLASTKPGVRYFEGISGIKYVINDTLTSKEIIYSYLDIEAIVKYTDKINKEYSKKREELGIKKRGIVVDSPFARKYLKEYLTSTTETRFIDNKIFPFNSIMQIYNNKVSYISLSEEKMIGLIIEDKNIYKMHRSIYELVWENAKNIDQLAPFSSAQ